MKALKLFPGLLKKFVPQRTVMVVTQQEALVTSSLSLGGLLRTSLLFLFLGSALFVVQKEVVLMDFVSDGFALIFSISLGKLKLQGAQTWTWIKVSKIAYLF